MHLLLQFERLPSSFLRLHRRMRHFEEWLFKLRFSILEHFPPPSSRCRSYFEGYRRMSFQYPFIEYFFSHLYIFATFCQDGDQTIDWLLFTVTNEWRARNSMCLCLRGCLWCVLFSLPLPFFAYYCPWVCWNAFLPMTNWNITRIRFYWKLMFNCLKLNVVNCCEYIPITTTRRTLPAFPPPTCHN